MNTGKENKIGDGQKKTFHTDMSTWYEDADPKLKTKKGSDDEECLDLWVGIIPTGDIVDTV
jgi:hypothetical protein